MNEYRILLLQRLRLVASSLLLLALISGVLPIASAVAALFVVLGALALLRWRNRRHAIADAELASHLIADSVVATVVLYALGGAGSAFVSLYLVPIGIAAAMLKPRWLLAVAIAIAACYSVLLWDFLADDNGHGHHFSQHVLGMWVNFLFSAFLIGSFVSALAVTVRRRDRALGEARAAALEHEQVDALATQAAGLAHELATPLSSALTVIEDLRSESGSSPDLDVVAEQLNHCADSVRRLAAAEVPGLPTAIPLDQFIHNVMTRWQLLRPGSELSCSGHRSKKIIHVDAGLQQALISLLNNAADTGSSVCLRLSVGEQFLISIEDNGPGFPVRLLELGVEAFVSEKSEGIGVGLWLAQRHIQRLGGDLRLENSGDGARCVVSLPIGAAE